MILFIVCFYLLWCSISTILWTVGGLWIVCSEYHHYGHFDFKAGIKVWIKGLLHSWMSAAFILIVAIIFGFAFYLVGNLFLSPFFK